MRPLIAVTTSMYAGESYRLPQIMLGATYVAALEDAGGTALLLTPAHQADSISRVLDTVQGLVLTGGEDVEPTRYGQEPHPKLGSTNPVRDEMEFTALQCAIERRLPVLGICRGMQLLNVALGGTLYQDLPSQRPGSVIHQLQASINQRWHAAQVEPGSALAEIFGTTELQINSFHHQGIDRLAPGLEALAWSEDGLIEAVQVPELPWAFGVQWHPERGEAESTQQAQDPDRRLFWAFVEAARTG